jgi:hypothetical protein
MGPAATATRMVLNREGGAASWRSVIAGGALASVLAGCTEGTMPGTSKPSEERSASVEIDGYRLRVDVLEATPESLEIRYTFQNGGDRSAYLFNHLFTGFDAPGVIQDDKDRVYVTADRGGVVLSKKIFPVPHDMDVEQPNVPAAMRVARWESASETIRLKLPLSPGNPYDRGAKPGPWARPKTLPVSFELGFLRVPPEGEGLALVVATTSGPAYDFGSMPAASQTILRTPLSVAVPVLLIR